MAITLVPGEAWALPPADPRNVIALPDLQQDEAAKLDETKAAELEGWSGAPLEPPAEYNPTDVTPPAGPHQDVLLGSAGDQLVQAGDLPVSIGQASPTASEPNPPAPSGTWGVDVEPRADTETAEVAGAIITLTPPSTGSTPVDVELDYSKFEDLYGTEWSSRLELVQLPQCFLTSPELAECTTAVDVPSDNDPSGETVRATVDPAASQAQGLTPQAGGGPVVLAATDSAAGAGGTYKATSLSPTGTWTAGGSGGGFSWSYPLSVPALPAGPAPKVSFSYSSQAVDGKTSVANGQASWIGDGWDYTPGFIERRYRSCSEDRKLGNGGPPNNDNATDKKKSDLCWASDNVVMSLGGSSTELVHDEASGKWIPANDDGAKVEYKAKDGTSKDVQTDKYDNEYWVITTRDGTKYWFGRNDVDGAGSRPVTNSVFTAPVFGNHVDEPCHASTYAGSSCTQAWRWNLDYVEDLHGNAMIIDWAKETNYYAENQKYKSKVSYVRGGYPTQILYGLRAGALTGPPAGRVQFTVGERCIKEGVTDCTDAEFESKNYEDKQPWWDTPSTLNCKQTATNCFVTSPTFWTRKRLTAVTTYGQRTPGSTTLSLVDRWNLQQSFPKQRTATHPPLWLESITRTGFGTTKDSAGAQDSTPLPAVAFLPNVVDMPNRVSTGASDQTPDFDRLRVETIRTETGGEIYVDYSDPCPVGSTHPAPAQNTTRCFPARWSPDPDLETPPLEWFNKYVVDRIIEKDRVARQPDVVTSYVYEGDAAWAKDTDEFSKAELRTYNQWRGYASVVVKHGVTANTGATDATEQSQTRTRYFRGMSGDAGRAAITVKDSTGTEDLGEDLPAHQGRAAETITYSKAGGSLITRQLTWPYAKKTASRARAGLPALEAWRTGTTRTDSIQTISGDKERTSRTVNTFDTTYGLPITSHTLTLAPDASGTQVVGNQSCTTTSYVHNTSVHLIGLPARVRTTVGDCDQAATATGDKVVSDTRTSYDALDAFATPPVKGLPYQVDTVNGAGTGWITSARTTYDALGRATKVTDAADNATTTAYTPATGPAFQVTVTNAAGHTSTTASDPARGTVLSVTDPNGRKLTSSYDDLGRVTGVWTASRTQGTDKASALFEYQTEASKAPAVTTRTLRDNGTYEDSVAIYDGLLRPRQTQTEALGGGRIVTDTLYSANGTVRQTNNGYYAKDEPDKEIFVPETVFQIPNSTETAYDGLGRAVRTTTLHKDVPQHSATARYEGDWTLSRTGMSPDGTTPLSGSRAVKTWTDALGRTSKVQHFTATDLTTKTDTSYTYDPRGKLDQVTDAKGNNWTYTYDARGRLTTSTDPDMGKASVGYNTLDQKVWSKDEAERTQHTVYDVLGRQIELHDDSASGPLVAKWTYDSLPGGKGHPVSSTRYNNGAAFTREVTGYDAEYRPTGSKVTIPITTGTTGLAGTYAYASTYTETGKPQTTTLPATPGGLASEVIVNRYNGEGSPITTSGLSWYTADTIYSSFGDVLRTTSGEAPRRVWTTNTYDENTGRINQSITDRETAAPNRISALKYGYDTVGNVTSITDTQSPTRTDRQCFAYDPMGRLVHAWTGASAGCPAASGTQGAGPNRSEVTSGPDGDGYWQSYEFDAIGNRTRMTVHDLTDANLDDVDDYTYGKTVTGNGTQPPSTAQPHTLTRLDSTEKTLGSTVTSLSTYAYDTAGNTTQRVLGGDPQALTWDRRNKLTSVDNDNNGTADVTYLYDADGNRLIEDNGTTRTLFLGEAEITVNTAGQAIEAQRYYTHPGAPTTVRSTGGKTTGHKLTVLLADHHNTVTSAIEQTANQAIKRRKYDPYGNPRGTEPADWPGRHTFLGTGVDDPTTGLTHIGAREYDASTGRFLSVDPVIDITDPLQMNGYTYANGSPVTSSDPSGLYCDSCNWDTPQGNRNGKSKPEGSHPDNTSDGQDGSGLPVVKKNLGDGESKLPPKKLYTEYYVSGLPTPGQIIRTNGSYAASLSYELNVELHFRERCNFSGANEACRQLRKFYGNFKHVKSIDTIDACPICGNPGFDLILMSRIGGGKGRIDCIPHSFAPDTLVLMADGTTKPIKDVKNGDKVLATDPKTGKTRVETINAQIQGEGLKHLVKITIDTDGEKGAATATVTSTEGHPFWVPELGKWIHATDLKPGDWLQTSAGTYVQVTAIKRWTDQSATVHNLTISNLHTYYVLAGATPVLVHNCNRAGLDFTDAERQKVYDANLEKNGGVLKCDYCGQEVVRRPSTRGVPGRPDDAQIDHVEPRVGGGHGGEHNGVVACRRCNRDKSTKPLEDWDDELREFLGD
ncbi:polymorphic toxin-type HINT domain-containing protein [Streptomyces sp. NBC_00210]|uniref:polymorphic toxin-type HINT domain-containing protein n=1 Tax=Streptomyces sp. NBC_00210 TaxID=2903636 RepID=UPI00324ADA01